MKLERKRLNAVINEWKKILKIDTQWDISFDIHDSPLQMSEDCQDAMACIDVDLNYFAAHIEFNATDIEEEDIDYIVVHELLHILLEPIALSSACGLGAKYDDMATMLCESTIERLIPGYLTLKGKAKQHQLKNGSHKKKNVCAVKRSKSHRKV